MDCRMCDIGIKCKRQELTYHMAVAVKCINRNTEERMGKMTGNKDIKKGSKERNGKAKGGKKVWGRSTLKSVHGKDIKRLESIVSNLSGQIKGVVRQWQGKMDGMTEGLSGKIDGMMGKFEILMELKQLGDVKEWKGEWEKVRNQLNDLEGAVKKLMQAEGEKAELTNKLNKQTETISGIGQKLEEVKKELSTKGKELSDKESELDRTETALHNAERKLEEYSGRFGGWEELTEPYRDLMEKMYRCPSLQEIIVKYALGEDLQSVGTMENMLKFIGVVGVGGSFAQEVYNVMRSYKKINAQYLTEEERGFIAELNGYCRRVLPAEFDVLDIPETGKFDSAAMQDMEKPTAPYRNMAGVYVPGLRGDAKSFKQRAIVHGTKG